MPLFSQSNLMEWLGAGAGGYGMEYLGEYMQNQGQSFNTTALAAGAIVLGAAYGEDYFGMGTYGDILDGLGEGVAGWLGAYLRRHQNQANATLHPPGVQARVGSYQPQAYYPMNYQSGYQAGNVGTGASAGSSGGYTDTEAAY